MDARTAQETPETAIQAVLDDWLDAFHQGDVERIMTHYTADVRSFDAVTALQFRGREDYAAHWKACMDFCSGEPVGEFDQVEIECDGDLAFAHMLMRCGMVGEDGRENSGWMRYTVCMRRDGNAWRIAHEHVSTPFDMNTSAVLFDLTP
ncbi:SgcJ/EcaC family oxidoreductase [Ectothiorhodospiraceae bacterium WFHF3C12]|nr:SgcJ/EcaC family oxidoreductase [Ectothiorhodospiraceae bacterium WFHF3C12]